MDDPFDLARFVMAQSPVFDAALAELRAGHKRTHWMWFTFPQIAGLGHSPTAQFYAIHSRAEARAFLDHPVLGARLQQATDAVMRWAGQRDAQALFGSPDDVKFRSSMTLFAAVEGHDPAFRAALQAFFGGAPDPATLSRLAAT